MPLLRSLCLLILLASTTLSAQEFSGGFRAGLNFITFSGDAETDGAGMTLEDFNRTTGFHVGATFAYELTDLFGFKADLMYSQKGGEVLYDGPSYLFLYAPDGLADRNQGNLQSERDVLNSYIDIPVVTYYRLGPLELEGGVSMGFLVNSRASGSATYTNTLDAQGRGLGTISYNYDYNYFEKTIGREAVLDFSDNSGGLANVPAVVNAYYNSTDNRPLYRRLDFGLVAGVSFFLNNGLYLGARYQFGLTDATRGENDQRLYSNPSTVGDIEYNTNDKDYNRVIQTSVGFRF